MCGLRGGHHGCGLFFLGLAGVAFLGGGEVAFAGVRGFGSEALFGVADGEEEEDAACEDAAPSDPVEDDGGDGAAVVSVAERGASVFGELGEERLAVRFGRAAEVSAVICCYHGEGQGRGEVEYDCEHSADFPREEHGFGFVAFRPEEVEEECGAEDEGDKYSGEDVERCGADVVVVEDVDVCV